MHTAAIHWFRKGLRLHDNPALLQACREAEIVYPVFILDPHFANPNYVCVNRYAFLLQSLQDLDSSLRNIGSRLYLISGKPEEAFPVLFRSLNIQLLTYESDIEPYALRRDAVINDLARSHHVRVETHDTHTLHPLPVYQQRGRVVPKTMASFTSLFQSIALPLVPQPPPRQVHTNW